jgi:hypothetical protein
MKTQYKIMLGVILGSLAGYAYYYFFGCNGSCPLKSTWYIPTLYGAAVGLIAAFPMKKKEKDDKSKEDSN